MLPLICVIAVLLRVSSASYNQSAAISNLFFAYGAYCPSSQLKSWSCKWCHNHSDFQLYSVRDTGYSEWDLQVFTGYDPTDQQIVISFRGSSNTENWINDFTYFQKPWPGISGAYVHDGFYDAWQKLKPSVTSDFNALVKAHPGKKVLSTGHSLGAALAQVAALDLAMSSSVTMISWNYGSPRFGNQVLIDYYATKIKTNWRLVNINDIVPTVPPKEKDTPGVTSPYHHTWTEIHYTSDSPLKYTQCNGSGEDEKCGYVVPSANDHLWYLNIHCCC